MALGGPECEIDLTRLPSVLAIPLHDYFVEDDHPVMRLHRLCDTGEILTRFYMIVALGELRRELGGNPLPVGVLQALQPSTERPTFGQWRQMLSTLIDAIASSDGLVVPQVPAFVRQHLLTLMPGGDFPEACLVRLRNELVHSGGMTKATAKGFLDLWGPRFTLLLQYMRFIEEVNICFMMQGASRCLIGASAEGEDFAIPETLRQILPMGRVLLLREERWLDLWPLCDYDRAATETLSGRREAPTQPSS